MLFSSLDAILEMVVDLLCDISNDTLGSASEVQRSVKARLLLAMTFDFAPFWLKRLTHWLTRAAILFDGERRCGRMYLVRR